MAENIGYNSVEFYIYHILSLLIGYVLIGFVVNFVHNKYSKKEQMNVTMDYYGNKEHVQVVNDELTLDQSSLRTKYLIASILVKAATWVKAPYLYALYNRLHGFNREQIGLLYCLDNLSSFVLGPIIGSLCDSLGRKKFCVLYSVFVIAHISLRLTGSPFLALFAQITSGVCSVIIDTSYESWLNFEANLLFSNDDDGKRQKNAFLRELFTKQISIDCFSSIFLTGVATFLYVNYGIFYPFYLCMLFSVISGVYILFAWKENDLSLLNYSEDKDTLKNNFLYKLKLALAALYEDKALLAVGIIESTFKIALSLFNFIWTPLLEETSHSLIHPGAIFVCFMIARLIGSEVFEGAKKILKTNTYILSVFITITGAASFWIEYQFGSFQLRLAMLIYFDGLSGIFMPLMSSLKSQMIPEKMRTTIMSFFRLPINLFCIGTLFFSKYVTTFQICLIAFLFMTVSFSVNILLFMWHTPPDADKRIILKSTKLRSSKNLKQFQGKDGRILE